MESETTPEGVDQCNGVGVRHHHLISLFFATFIVVNFGHAHTNRNPADRGDE